MGSCEMAENMNKLDLNHKLFFKQTLKTHDTALLAATAHKLIISVVLHDEELASRPKLYRFMYKPTG